MENEKWSENIIIVDADYVDSVAFDLVVNFERMINRRIPNADMAQWLDCIALDGGMKPSENNDAETQVIFLHKPDTKEMKMFSPGNLAEELNGKAFKDDLGEFSLSSYPAPDNVVSVDEFLIDVLKTAANHKDVKRIMVIGDCNDGTLVNDIRRALRDINDNDNDDVNAKRITVFAMQPIQGGNYRTEILGYSLMAALGIRSEELGR